jgi:Spy/CpxP family protein refolding chaperone
MKKWLLAAVCVVALNVGNAWAVEHTADSETLHRPKHEMKMETRGPIGLAQELNLTDEQKKTAEKIREDGWKKMEPLIRERKELDQKMDALRKENMEEFEKILTAEQKTTFEALKKQKHHRKMRRPMTPDDATMPPPPPGDEDRPMPRGDNDMPPPPPAEDMEHQGQN